MLNIRGNDIPCNPVVLSYLVLTETESHLFIQEETLNEKVKQYLADLGISLHPYDAVYDFVSGITGKTILLEKAKVNYTICQSVMGSNTIVNVMNPASSLKAVKTPVEMENIRKAHIKDGVAVTRFVYWLKKNIGKIPMDEVSVAEKLESFRKEQEGFIETITGKGSFVAAKDTEVIREGNLRIAEEYLAKAAELAKKSGIPLKELVEVLELIYNGE